MIRNNSNENSIHQTLEENNASNETNRENETLDILVGRLIFLKMKSFSSDACRGESVTEINDTVETLNYRENEYGFNPKNKEKCLGDLVKNMGAYLGGRMGKKFLSARLNDLNKREKGYLGDLGYLESDEEPIGTLIYTIIKSLEEKKIYDYEDFCSEYNVVLESLKQREKMYLEDED